MTKVLEFFLHLIELVRDRPGHERHRGDRRAERRRHLPVPPDPSSYPYYPRLDDRQLVDEDDLTQ
jgi:hypothetical protein